MKKILFCDMDGTIINENEMKYAPDREALLKLQEAGHYIAFDTGRNYQEACSVVNRHQFPYDYLVLNNGAHIVCKDHKDVFKKMIPHDIGCEILEYCMQFPDLKIYFFNGKVTYGYLNGQVYEHQDHGEVEVDHIDFVQEYKNTDQFDIIAVHQINKEIDVVLGIQKYIREHYGHIAEGCLNTIYLDITAAGCTKGTGIEILTELLDGDMETYAIGDSYNDISMFKVAHHAYTFHDIDDSITQYTQHQVSTVSDVVEDMLA